MDDGRGMSEPRLGLVILAVEQLARSAAFYDQAFGWRRTVDSPVYVELALPGGMRLGLYDRHAFRRTIGHMPATRPTEVTATELYVYVDDLDAAVTNVCGAGGRILSPAAARDWGDVVGYLADPDGNVLALARPRS
jgi:predicted enzyme related to lactoylglutathione lyase